MMGAGVETLLPSPDLPPATAIAGARGVFAAEAAEYAIAAMLALCRDVPRILDQQRTRRFQQFESPKLEGGTVAILGLGEIGRRVARACAGLGMHVTGVCRVARVVEHVAEVRGPDGLVELLARADYVVVALPKTPETTGLLDARAIAAMKGGARVVHLSRGGIVDEAALRAALESGALAGAAIDVFVGEPLSENSPWWSVPSTVVSPHVAGLGERYLERCIELLLDNVARLERGDSLAHLVDRARGY
jgi:phosphoglycerate dehydrogenase-like enzyme